MILSYKQNKITIWYHSKGRKWREAKQLLDEGEGREWKSWLKTKYLRKKTNYDHGIWPHYFMANRRGKCGSSDRFPLLELQNHCGWWLQPWHLKMIDWQESHEKPGQCVEKQTLFCRQRSIYLRLHSSQWSHTVIKTGP